MIRHNVTANVVARAWGIISVYLFVPLYLKFLGIEAYGLVGFYSTLLGVLAFADMGFTATLNREMARLSVRKDSAREMRDLLRTYEALYLCISSAIAITIQLLAPFIAERWLRSKDLQPHEIAAAIRLMGVSIALQLPSGLYIGGLMGLQRQVRANLIQMAWGLFRGVGTVLVLRFIAPTIFAFALWQLASNGAYCLAARWNLWRVISSGSIQFPASLKWHVLRKTSRFAAGMTGMAVVSTVLSQTDKLVVSKTLPLEMLGYYTLAGALAAVPLMLAGPIASAVFPRLTGLVALGDRKSLALLYHRTCEAVAVAVIPVGLTVAFFAGAFIQAWTGSSIIAQRAGLVASLLFGGQLLQAITVVPYYLALAHGNVQLNVKIGLVSIVISIPLLLLLLTKYGLVGAGLSWLIINLCTVPPYMYFLHRRFLPGELRRWWVRSVVRPMLVALPCVLLGHWAMPHTSTRLFSVCSIGLVGGVAGAATALSSFVIREELAGLISRRCGPSFVHFILGHRTCTTTNVAS